MWENDITPSFSGRSSRTEHLVLDQPTEGEKNVPIYFKHFMSIVSYSCSINLFRISRHRHLGRKCYRERGHWSSTTSQFLANLTTQR
jgi:hypothetical protein